MYDVGQLASVKKHTFKIGVGYEYWQNKYGNNADFVPGVFAHTPMVRSEYHF